MLVERESNVKELMDLHGVGRRDQNIKLKKMNRKELKKVYEEGLMTLEEYGKKLVELESKPKQKKENRIYTALSEDEFLKLLKAVYKPIHYICFILAAESGLRVSEVVKLKVEDINLQEHKLFIRQAKGANDRIVNTPKHLKNKHLKYFPLNIQERAISKAFLSASKRAGINSVIYTDHAGRPRYKFHYHCLRHTFAQYLIKNGVKINDVQRLLGHANLATTSRYAQRSSEDAIASVLERGL